MFEKLILMICKKQNTQSNVETQCIASLRQARAGGRKYRRKNRNMKMYIILGITGLLIISGICVYKNGRENNMNKKIPENTLAVFADNKETVYLLSVGLINGSDGEYYADMIDENFTGNGDYIIQYITITGNYPKDYDGITCSLHIIPQNGIYKFESRLESMTRIQNYRDVGFSFETDGRFHLAGYSNDKDLPETKIFEYYLSCHQK
jgi:hypothetical protein